jgi:microcystin synthetase protein McyJ
MDDRKQWHAGMHEKKVEAFYGQGVGNITDDDFRGGFLSFGYWASGTTDYVTAAKALVDELKKRMGLGSDSRLLDVACGMGAQDAYLMETTPVASIDAIDVTWPHVVATRERVAKAGFAGRVHVHHGTATALPFPDASFSHVLSIEGPEHFHTRELFMREAFRVLRPGGVMVVSDYALTHDPRNVLEQALVDFVGWLWRVPKENHDTNARYQEKLERAGFRDVGIENVGKDVIPGYYFSHMKPEERERVAKLRGWKTRLFGPLIDWGVYKTFDIGAVEYVLVRAVKP